MLMVVAREEEESDADLGRTVTGIHRISQAFQVIRLSRDPQGVGNMSNNS